MTLRMQMVSEDILKQQENRITVREYMRNI